MNILLIGDTHFKTDNALESDDFILRTLEYVQEEKENINLIVLLGDILDTHEKINLQPFHRATNFILELAKLVKTFVLIGNHDRLNNSVFLTDEHPFVGLKYGNDNLIIVDEVVEYENLIFVPYVPKGKFLKALETIEYNKDTCKASVIFAHQEFVGACINDDPDGLVSRDGDYWPKDSIPIYSGHIHKYQKIENITYVGTPFQHSFNEPAEDKMLMLLTINEPKFKEPEITETRIKLNIIKKRQITINVKDVANHEIDTEYITRLIIEGEDKAVRKIIMNKDIALKLKHPNLRYKIKYIETNKKNETIDVKKEKLNFSEILKQKIANLKNEKVKDLFEEIKS